MKKQFTKQWSFPVGERIERLEFEIRIETETSDIAVEDLGLEPETEAKLLEAIERGQTEVTDVSVFASWNGIEGSDHLGANFISTPLDLEQNVIGYNNMIENACENLTAEMERLFEKLNVVFGGGK